VKHILARNNRSTLEQFAWSKSLVGLDFDGTLAPIMLDPQSVTLKDSTRHLVAAVAALYPTAVISGRARKDVAARLRGLPLYEIIGNHGLEPALGHNRASNDRSRVAHWLRRLHGDLDDHPGIEIEDKGLSLAVHYRRSRAKRRAQVAIAASVAQLGPLRVLGGKQVVNLLPKGAPDKGQALLAVVKRAGCDKAIYVGDDDTDEDVFALDDPGQLLTIRVGRNFQSQASYYLRHRGEVEILLRTLRDVRAGRRS
jgi:trehalose 6-phosphate phosphatase